MTKPERGGRRIMTVSAVVFAITLLTGTAYGHGRIPDSVPVERLVANLETYIKEHPGDAEAYYRLGRVHALALEGKHEEIMAWPPEGPLEQPTEGSWSDRRWEPAKGPESTGEQRKAHLEAAIKNLNRAIEMRPGVAKYHLTMACVLETGESLIDQVEAWPLLPTADPALKQVANRDLPSSVRSTLNEAATSPDARKRLLTYVRGGDRWNSSPNVREFAVWIAHESRDDVQKQEIAAEVRREDWHEQILTQFYEAMCLALPLDSRQREQPIWGTMKDWVAYEAACDFVRVAETRKDLAPQDVRLKAALAAKQAFDDLPRSDAITPIIFDPAGRALKNCSSAESVSFDLDGSALPQNWTWVKSGVGILAWDPDRTGKITSGKQLFGSVSWWLFFDNGYQALELLDDNHDGQLAGDELRGIAAWFDRNSNGISDAGEVVPVEKLDIAAISTRMTGHDGASPISAQGIRFTDGRTVPSYDWIAERR